MHIFHTITKLICLVIVVFLLSGCISHQEKVPVYSDATLQKTKCQLLLNDKEAEEQGFARQRRMYSHESSQHLSEQAVREGFGAATRSQAMDCFNRAWRFNPENPIAYWGAGIVRGIEAVCYLNEELPDIAKNCWDECVSLFETGERYLPAVPPVTKCEYHMDQAQSYMNYAATMKSSLEEQGLVILLKKAEALLLQYADCKLFQEEENRHVRVRVAYQLSQVYNMLGQIEKFKKYNKIFLQLATPQEKLMFESKEDGKWAK